MGRNRKRDLNFYSDDETKALTIKYVGAALRKQVGEALASPLFRTACSESLQINC
jgi:hypothetical protein